MITIRQAPLTGSWIASGKASDGHTLSFTDTTSDASQSSALKQFLAFREEHEKALRAAAEKAAAEKAAAEKAAAERRAEEKRLKKRGELHELISKLDMWNRTTSSLDWFMSKELGLQPLSAARTHLATVARIISTELANRRAEFRND